MFKYKIGELVKYCRVYQPRRAPVLDFKWVRPIYHVLPDYTIASKVLGEFGIVLKQYPSQKAGDSYSRFVSIPFDNENMYVVYFQEQMEEYLCFESELETP